MKIQFNIKLNSINHIGGFVLLVALFFLTFSCFSFANAPAIKPVSNSVSGSLIPVSLRWSEKNNSIFKPTNFVITGATLLPYSRLNPLYSNLKNAPFKIRDILGVMRQIARLYRQENFYGVEVSLDLENLENNIVAIHIIEPEDLKNDILAKAKGRELKTPKILPVKITPKPAVVKVEKKKTIPKAREKIVKKAIKQLKKPVKTNIEKRIKPDNKNAKQVKDKIYLLPEKYTEEQVKGVIKLLHKDRLPDIKSVPEPAVIVQENIKSAKKVIDTKKSIKPVKKVKKSKLNKPKKLKSHHIDNSEDVRDLFSGDGF